MKQHFFLPQSKSSILYQRLLSVSALFKKSIIFHDGFKAKIRLQLRKIIRKVANRDGRVPYSRVKIPFFSVEINLRNYKKKICGNIVLKMKASIFYRPTYKTAKKLMAAGFFWGENEANFLSMPLQTMLNICFNSYAKSFSKKYFSYAPLPLYLYTPKYFNKQHSSNLLFITFSTYSFSIVTTTS